MHAARAAHTLAQLHHSISCHYQQLDAEQKQQKHRVTNSGQQAGSKQQVADDPIAALEEMFGLARPQAPSSLQREAERCQLARNAAALAYERMVSAQSALEAAWGCGISPVLQPGMMV